MVINKRAFRKLSKPVQDAVLSAAKAAEARGWEMSKKETSAKMAVLESNGVKIVKPSDELMRGMRDIGVQMLAEWKASAGADGEAILSAYKK